MLKGGHPNANKKQSRIDKNSTQKLKKIIMHNVDYATILKEKEIKTMIKYTTYSIAVTWLNNNFILCNNITEVDPSTLDNMRFDYYEEESDSYVDIYQYYITDASLDDVEFLEKNFNLKFTYSDLLDSFILCVDHWGTGWDYVSCECSEDLLKYNPELEYNDSCYPPKRETTRRIIKGGRQ